MGQQAAIAIVVLVEVIVVLVAVIAFLGWRLRRARAGTPAPASMREWFDLALEDLSSTRDGSTSDETARRRRQALDAERRALDSGSDEERRALFREAYMLPESTDGESERLRRLLQREAERLGELLAVRDELKDLRVRYDRVRRLAERLAAGEVADGQLTPVLETYRQLESQWLERMGALETRFETATEDLDLLEENAEATPTGTSGEDPHALLSGQREIVSRLQERLADIDDEAVEDLNRLAAQMSEFEACVRMLETQDPELSSREVDGDAATTTVDEMAQAIAMKDREIDDLRARLARPEHEG